MIVTRFAPSPTGRLHLGHAFSAIRAHDFARERNGSFLLRIEERFELSQEANGTLLKHIARFRGLLPAIMPRKFIQRRAIHIYRTPIEWLQRYFEAAPAPAPQPPPPAPNRFQRRSARSRR